MRVLLGVTATIALFALISACGSNANVTKVNINLAEWSIKVDPASVPKGPVEFTVMNDGQKSHEVQIIQTNIPPDQLPTKSDGSVNTEAPDVKVVHTVDAIDGGDKTGRTFDMDAGTYVLISNLVDESNGAKTAQYGQGMYTSFTVTAGSGSASASAAASPSPTKTSAIAPGSSLSATPTKSP